jgi:hypothetical protein
MHLAPRMGSKTKWMKSAIWISWQIRPFPPLSFIAAAKTFEERGGTYPDGEAYSRLLDGKTWEQLEPQYFARRSDSLSFMGSRHLIAVLPAYLNLLFVLGPRSPVPETLLPILARPEDADPNLKKRFDELTN